MKLESFRYELAVAETLEQIKLLDTKAAAIAEIQHLKHKSERGYEYLT